MELERNVFWTQLVPAALQSRIVALCAASALEDAVAETLGALRTDREFRAQCDQVITAPQVFPKDDDRSRMVRSNEGNAEFKQKHFEAAAIHYTQALCLAASPAEQQLAVLNRSAALLQLHRYRDALDDAQWVLSRDPACAKARVRAALSAAALGNAAVANDMIRVLKQDQATAAEARAAMARLLQPPARDQSAERADPCAHGPADASYGAAAAAAVTAPAARRWPDDDRDQPWLRCAERTPLRLESSPSWGRFLVTAAAAEAGAELLREEPFCAVVRADAAREHCHFCFRYVPACAWPCTDCSLARYCSEMCRTADWQGDHGVECGRAFYKTVSDSVRLAVRAVRRAAPLCTREGGSWVCGALAPLPSAEEPASAAATRLLARRFQQLCSLSTHAARQPPVLLVAACVGAAAAELCGVVPAGSAATVAALTLAARCNAFTVAVYARRGERVERVRAALALCPAAAMMNHSCVPSATVSFEGRVLVARAARKLAAGQSVTHSYGPLAGRMPRDARQAALRDEYYFTCDCEACHQSVDWNAFRCARCGGRLPAEAAAPAVACVDCHQSAPLAELRADLERARSMISVADKLEERGELKRALQAAQTALDVYRRVLHASNPELGRAHDTLARLHAAQDEYDAAARAAEASVAVLTAVFGDESIEVAHEALKLAQLYAAASQPDPAERWLRRSEHLFTVHLGPRHPFRSDVEAVQDWLRSFSDARRRA